MEKNNYDYIAPFYVLIRTMVFGKKTENAYNFYLDMIEPGQKVLIAGGGAGKILLHKKFIKGDVPVFYLEKSKRMIGLARNRIKTPVNFIYDDILTYKPATHYDVVILPFVLDLFRERNLTLIISRVSAMLNTGGMVIVSDFTPPHTFKEKLLIKLMFLFFRFATNIESDKLLRIEDFMTHSPLKRVHKAEFERGFIFSAVYTKT